MLLALFTVHFSLSVNHAAAQATWNEGFTNSPQNLRYGSKNPTRLAYNHVRDFAVADINYSLTRGDFHAIDASGDAHDISAYIGGLRHIGQFDVQGHLSYKNQKDNNQSWNSTLWNNNNNPFLLCDSIAGDATTESYDMGAAAAYTFNDRLKAGLQIGLRTGSRSDQSDPRPRTVTTVLPITIGADYQLSGSWNIGAAVGYRLFSSYIEYTYAASTNAVPTRYFLMKGMSDYAKRSSSDERSYKRDYQGNDYSATLSATWQPADGPWANMLETTYTTGSEDATDGGDSYNFLGGDYDETVLTVSDRLQWRPSRNMLHNLTLTATMTDGKGTWYDQKRELDHELSGSVIYRMLGKSINHKTQRTAATLQYRFDLFDAEGRQDLFAALSGTMESITRKQLLGDATPKQEIQTVDLALEVGKAFYMNKVTLLAQLNGGLRTPQKQTYASGCIYTDDENIDAVYTRHVFEYETAQSWRIGATVDVSMPVSDKLTAGIYAKGRYQAYNGKNDYWQGYDGTHLTTADFGAYIKF